MKYLRPLVTAILLTAIVVCAWRSPIDAKATVQTVIADAPNPAGVALLRRSFADESVGALRLLVGALAPAAVAAAVFLGPRQAQTYPGFKVLRATVPTVDPWTIRLNSTTA